MLSLLKNLGLREKLVALALLVLIPLTVLQVVSILSTLGENARTEQQHSQEVAGAVGAAFVRYLNLIWAAQESLASTVTQERQPGSPSARHDLLATHVNLDAALLGTALLDEHGSLSASTLPANSLLLPWLNEHYSSIVSGNHRVVSDLVQLDGGPAVVLVASGVRREGLLAGAVITAIDPTQLGPALPMPGYGSSSYQLVDRTGRIVYHSQAASLPLDRQKIVGNPHVRAALSGEARGFTRSEIDADGGDRLGAAVPIPGIGWAAIASTPTPDRLGPAYLAAWLQLEALGAIMIASLGAALFLGGRLLNPILALTAAAGHSARGDFSARAGAVPARDEIAAAVNTFGQMAAQIQFLEEERDRFYTLSASLLCTLTLEGRFLRLNPEWERTLGLSRAELMGTPALELVHPDDRAAVTASLQPVAGGEPSREFECRLRCRDGSWKWFTWSAAPFPFSDVMYVVGQHITELKTADAERIYLLTREQAARAAAEEGQRRLAFLAEASTILASSIDYQTTLGNVARLAVPRLADWCTVHVFSDQGDLQQIAVAHRDPSLTEWAFAQLHEPDRQHSATWNAIETAKPVLLEEVDESWLEQVANGQEHLDFLRQLHIRSAMMVPMLARGEVIGVLGFLHSESNRRYSPADLSLAEELATRAALAVENARLYRGAQAAATRAAETVALLDTLLESAPVGIAFLDTNLRYARVNDALAAMSGTSTEQLLGRTLREVAPQLAPVVEPVLRRVMRSGEPVVAWESPGRGNRNPGDQRHWLESIYPVQTQDGKVLGTGIMVTDITDRKRMEEALRESELLLSGQKHVLEMIVNGCPPGEIQRTIVRFVENQIRNGVCALWQVDPTGALRFAAAPSLPPAYRDAIDGADVATSASIAARAVRERTLVIVPAIEKDPGWEPHRQLTLDQGFHAAWAAPILTAKGGALGALTVFYRNRRPPRSSEQILVEIFAHLAGIAIERHNAEEVRTRKLESLIAHTAEGVVAVDEEGRLIVVNAAARRLLGLPVTADAPSMVEAGLPAALAEILRQASRPDCRSPAQHTINCGAVDLDVHVSPVVAGLGHHFGAIALLQDITAVAQLRRLQESFVANVSHELRAPLASLSAMAEAIKDNVASDEDRTRYMKAIVSETERLRRLTNDVLELSRLDAGVVEIAREEFEINLVLESIQENWELRCGAAGIHLDVGRTDLRVVADYDRVLQVLTNLVDNATKFTPPGGIIRVTANPSGNCLRLGVADTGPGIPAGHLPYVWQRFYMIDKARTRIPGSGTGLGLAIARHLVENMGGEVGVQSEPGTGCRFWFTLPLAGV